MPATLRRTAILVTAIGLFIGLWLVYPHEFVASDPWNYSLRAFGIADRLDFGPNDVFSHRLAVTTPAAALYGLFGISELTSDVWPLCASILIMVVVWLALPDSRSKAFGAFFCLSSVALIRASTALLPDLIAGAFMAASTLLLFRRRDLAREGVSWLAPLSIALAFVAFAAKESAYWVLPLWIGAFAIDTRDTRWRELWRRFYLPVAITGAVIGVAYLVFCQLQWGDALARFSAIQALTGQHIWAWTKTSTWELTKRLTVAPAMLLTSQYGLPVLALAGIGLVLAPAQLVPWGWYTGACVFFYWFGSTSFTRYEPMPLTERMTLPALPGLYILAAYGASRVSVLAPTMSRRAAWLPIALVASLVAAPLAQELLSWRGHQRPEARVMAIVRDAVLRDPGHQYLLLSSDPRSPEALAFFFGYQYPSNLRVTSVDAFVRSALPIEAHRAFVFANRERSQFLAEAFGVKSYDAEIADTGLAPTYDVGGVSLWVTDDVGGLKQRLQSAAGFAR